MVETPLESFWVNFFSISGFIVNLSSRMCSCDVLWVVVDTGHPSRQRPSSHSHTQPLLLSASRTRTRTAAASTPAVQQALLLRTATFRNTPLFLDLLLPRVPLFASLSRSLSHGSARLCSALEPGVACPRLGETGACFVKAMSVE
uniref:Uncharacterized protein n=1 Tax=Knipowitschia caucasica TaxID=637954 RepID=A0AAV2KB42_KNICA